jgi:HD superfamily phosphohydrolase
MLLIKDLNKQFDGRLQMAVDIFANEYPKKFLYQLVSGQLDMDRMDYLTRDSFFTGVNEGAIGYDRILKMLTVYNGELMVEEKGIYSIEKFLVARRLMYWQVYLHKTVLSAEQMLQRIIKRARFIRASCMEPLNSIIHQPLNSISLEQFCSVDDYDVLMAIKGWKNHEDTILSYLCNGIIERRLLRVKYSGQPFSQELLNQLKNTASNTLHISDDDAKWLVFTGEATSSTYNFEDEHILILFKDGNVKDISEVDNALINENLRGKVKKYYICYIR